MKYENYAGATPEIMLIHERDFQLNQKSHFLSPVCYISSTHFQSETYYFYP